MSKPKLNGSFVHFWDMNSGGGQKENWPHIFIEIGDVEKAKLVFYNVFGHSPDRVTCTCCGEDYSISSAESLQQATGYERGCAWTADKYIEKSKGYGKFTPFDKFIESLTPVKVPELEGEPLNTKTMLIITKENITDKLLVGSVPSQGYVWQD